MPNVHQKIAIVSSGGGMRCVYAAGVFTAFAKKFGFTTPDIIVATSGSAGTAAYYLAGQYDEIEKIWLQHLSTPSLISLLRPWRVFDVNYLIDEVFKRQVPLQVQTFYSTPAEYHIPVLDSKSKQVWYITNTDGVDVFEILRAAKALPFLFGGKVPINNSRYIDGGYGLPFEDTLAYARNRGATHIIGIDMRSEKKRRLLQDKLSGSDVILLGNQELPVGLITRDPLKLKATFEMGYTDAAENPSVCALINKAL